MLTAHGVAIGRTIYYAARNRVPRTAEMPSPRAVTWSVVGRLLLAVTAVSVIVVLSGGTALWLVESPHPDGSLRTWGDAVWAAMSTMTTVG